MKLQAIPFTNNLVAVFKISFSACIIGNQHRAVVKFYLKEGMTEIHSMKTLLVQFWSLRSGRESAQSVTTTRETIEKVRDMNFEDRRLNVRKAAYQKIASVTLWTWNSKFGKMGAAHSRNRIPTTHS